VAKNNLWFHYKRFSEIVKNIDPVTEKFIPTKSETNILRVYKLDGQKTTLIWLRDKSNSWESELRDRQPPITISGLKLDLKESGINEPIGEISVYDPWQDKWADLIPEDHKITLPDFTRSLVVRIIK